MNIFRPTRGESGYLRIEQRIADTTIYVELKNGERSANSIFDPAEAPAIALAILESAGVEGESEQYGVASDPAVSLRRAAHYLSRHAEQAEQAAKEAARNKRRDTLYRELEGAGDFAPVHDSPMGRALDRIINLEEAGK